MNNTETGKDKIKKITEILKSETLEPAKIEAKKIIENAHLEAHKIIKAAEAKGEELLNETRRAIEKEKELLQSALRQSVKQGTEVLKQEIENKLLKEEIADYLHAHFGQADVVAKLVEALILALEKEGINADFTIYIPKTVSVKEVMAQLGKGIQERLKKGDVALGDFLAGVKVQLRGKQLTLDIGDQALSELLGRYVRKEFRTLFFQE